VAKKKKPASDSASDISGIFSEFFATEERAALTSIGKRLNDLRRNSQGNPYLERVDEGYLVSTLMSSMLGPPPAEPLASLINFALAVLDHEKNRHFDDMREGSRKGVKSDKNAMAIRELRALSDHIGKHRPKHTELQICYSISAALTDPGSTHIESISGTQYPRDRLSEIAGLLRETARKEGALSAEKLAGRLKSDRRRNKKR